MKFDYMPYIRDLLKDELKIEKVNNAIWHTGYWNDLDRGFDTDEVFSKMLEAEPDYREDIRLTFDNVGLCMHKADYAIPWIKELKDRGYRVLYLSNYAEHTKQANLDVLDFLPYMDGGIFSCDIGIIKPDSRIFKAICDKYGLIPEECVFIDDSKANAEAAELYGMHSIHFIDYETASKALKEIL